MKLAGLSVLDFSQFMAGPLLTASMADHGAKVIKIEPPGGDPIRHGPRSRPEQDGSDSFRVLNRGKRSLVLDLKQPAHREVALRLIGQADVVLESFRPGVADRLGIGYREASARKPDLVYCSISAFGQSGQLKDLPAHDTMVQALAGAFAKDAQGRPVEPPVSLAGVAAAQFALSAILMALLAVRSGQGGEHIDIAMYDAMLAIRGGLTAAALAKLDAPEDFSGSPAYALSASYRTADDRWLRVDARDRNAAHALLEALALPEWQASALEANNPKQAALGIALGAAFHGDSLENWLRRLSPLCGVAPILNYAQALAHSHTASRGLIASDVDGGKHLASPIRFLRQVPAGVNYAAPTLGEHTQGVLEEAGYSGEEIAALGLSADR